LNRRKKSPIGGILIFGLLVAGAGFVYTSDMFERDKPTISVESNGYWNLKKPIPISIDDASGLRSYKVTLKTPNNETVVMDEIFMSPKKEITLDVKAPRSIYAIKASSVTLIVEATDTSKWNLLKGNSVVKRYKLNIDKHRPRLNIVSHSYKISKGGSAIVIFKAEDENIDELYIESTNGKKFKVEEFYKDGYYISLLAWPVMNDDFKATVIAKDFAGNIAREYVPLYLKEKNYRVSNIKLSDKFLKGKIADLAEDFVETQGVENSLEQFRIINETVRAKNEKLIHELSSKVSDERISNFKINRMYPLRNAQVVARFGDHRKYFYDGDFISESYHLGLDLASNSMAKIKPQNGGEVVYADFNGLYGHMPMISHGLGLYTIYGHCSTLKVEAGEHIKARTVIANTGKSGYAMGDHLHFGVLVQGIEVRPQEWMDKDWIRINITNIIKNAKKIINRN